MKLDLDIDSPNYVNNVMRIIEDYDLDQKHLYLANMLYLSITNPIYREDERKALLIKLINCYLLVSLGFKRDYD